MIAQPNLSPTDHGDIAAKPTPHYSVASTAATTHSQDHTDETLSAASSVLHLTL